MVFRKERLCFARPQVAARRSGIEHVIAVEPPYRLDLTVAVLRRLSTNVVDVLSPGGEYSRAFGETARPCIAHVRQPAPDRLCVRLSGSEAEVPRALDLLQRMLGTRRSTPVFDAGATQIVWLHALAERMRGVRPPRYPSLWEACVNAIVFQQISLHAASAILRRMIVALCEPLQPGAELRGFPDITALAAASDETLRSAGLSVGKVAALRRVAFALGEGELSEPMLEERASPAAVDLLCGIKGIGPWTATVILLRGLGRLDVFPAGDSGVARSLTALSAAPVDIAAALAILGAERGMLYYHLLLARLEAAGTLPTVS